MKPWSNVKRRVNGNEIGNAVGKFAPDARPIVDQAVAEAAKAVAAIIKDGPDKAQNAFNGFAANR